MGIDPRGDSLNDLRGLSDDTQEIISTLRRHLPELKRDYNIESIQLFGSFLRGGRESANDLDLLVEFEKTPSLLRFIKVSGAVSTEELGPHAFS